AACRPRCLASVGATAMSVLVRPLREQDLEGCLHVVASLPQFFGVEDDGFRRIAKELDQQGGMVAAGPGGDIVGFLTWKRFGDGVAEITWMAVHANLRHHGVGTALLRRVEELLAAQGCRHVSLLTSAASDTYEPTRRFWVARGYATVLQLDGLWDADVASVYTKQLIP
ncbi:MAG TPA: GNAT family N-acetyltransferase, partial [Cryptosporangiaceae bacterium]|nr:GNAT family N-acetyltransferase [Cryptosporangiaceae bacterium]